MDHTAPRDRNSAIDLENGDGVTEEDTGRSPLSGFKRQARMFLAKIYGGITDESADRTSSSGRTSNSTRPSVENMKLVTGMNMEGQETRNDGEKKSVKDNHKKSSNKKSPKPPRPPRAPSLDAADQKLIREIAELARLKRARIERVKALKKMKAAKSSSSSGNAVAMVFTLILCVVIIFQGMCSGEKPAHFQASPVPSGAVEGSLISVQYFGNPSASVPAGPNSGSPNLLEQVAGSDPLEKPSGVSLKMRRLHMRL